jgi:hypothetical protein
MPVRRLREGNAISSAGSLFNTTTIGAVGFESRSAGVPPLGGDLGNRLKAELQQKRDFQGARTKPVLRRKNFQDFSRRKFHGQKAFRRGPKIFCAEVLDICTRIG